jgi:pyridoxine 5-phosphate synthase
MRLGINIDHVATVRNARGGMHPDPVRAAMMAQEAGADGITAHLREDRRHIRDADMYRLKDALHIPLNFEMAATVEMQQMALKLLPHAVCLVPERREEITTEGGLDVVRHQQSLRAFVEPLRDAGIRVSCFIEADRHQIEASYAVGAQCIELHTGAYAHAHGAQRQSILNTLHEAALYADGIGLEVHAGHGLDYENTPAIVTIPIIKELNIGHFLMGEAMFCGLTTAIQRMKKLMHQSAWIGRE